VTANLVHVAYKDLWVQKVMKVPEGLAALQVPQESKVFQVHLVPKVKVETRGHLAHQVLLDQEAVLDNKDHQVHKDRMVL